MTPFTTEKTTIHVRVVPDFAAYNQSPIQALNTEDTELGAQLTIYQERPKNGRVKPHDNWTQHDFPYWRITVSSCEDTKRLQIGMLLLVCAVARAQVGNGLLDMAKIVLVT